MAKIEEWDPGTGIYLYYCPACGIDHAVWTKYPNSLDAIWKWNGSLDQPTFYPSLDGKGKNESGLVVWRCHHYIENGEIRYLGDSTHALAGVKVPMVDRK